MGWTPDESDAMMMITIVIQGAGLGFVFVPLQVVAFYTMPAELRTQGTSLLSLVRNVGSAIGISITSALLDRETHVEHAVLSQYITPFNRMLQTGAASRMLAPATPGGASVLDQMITTQAQVIAYIDDYKFLLLTVIPSAACLLLMTRPKAAAAPSAGHAVLD
jgi:DHA2 family multidrug resistance protein